MITRKTLVLSLCFSLSFPAFADFRYDETTKVTGGSILSMMRLVGAFSKEGRQANEPVTATVLVKGNRMAHISNNVSEIIDLDKETITRIDHNKKQYSVVTFEQMKRQIEDAAKQMRQRSAEASKASAQGPELNFKVNVRDTGATRQVANLSAKEMILTMAMEAKDQKTGQTGAFDITNDMWMAPEIPGYNEVNDFNRRLAMKMGMVLSGAVSPAYAAMQPGTAKGMAELAKEMSKLKGVPVLQIMRMGSTANGQPLPAASEAPLPPTSDQPAMPSAGEIATGAASSAAASKLGCLGAMAAGLGGFGRKKKPQEQPAAAAPQRGPNAEAASVLIESSTEMTAFSSSAIETSRFEVPAGYKQIESEVRGQK